MPKTVVAIFHVASFFEIIELDQLNHIAHS